MRFLLVAFVHTTIVCLCSSVKNIVSLYWRLLRVVAHVSSWVQIVHHAKGAKEAACGCAGCYSAFNALGLYAEAFESVDKLDKLEGFASFFGPDFYSLPRNSKKITLAKQVQQIPNELPLGNDTIVPLRAGESIAWSLV